MVVDDLNNNETEMIGMKPIDAIKLKRVKLYIKPYPSEKVLPTDGLYRCLYKPGELEHDTQKRATDMNWSWNTFRLDKIIENPGQRVLYYLQGGPHRAFVREELILIPEETQNPSDWAKTW